MFNKTLLMGRICNDLELKTTPTGVHVLSFRIAVDRNFQTKGEERKADFFNIVAWRINAEFVSKYFGKGRMIFIEGELQTRQYVDKNNVTQNIVEIVADKAYFTGEKAVQSGYNNSASQGDAYGGGYQPQPQSQMHPAETANTAPAPISSGVNSDFSAPGGDDDYPF